MNMRKTFGAAVLAAGLTGASANAAVVLSDNFDSYVNGPLSAQGGWVATSNTTTPAQVAGESDKYVQLSTGQDEYKAFTSVVSHTDGNSLQTSFTANVSTASTNGDYFSHLSSPLGTTSLFYQRVFARSSGEGYQIGILETSQSGTTLAPSYGDTVLSFNTEYDIDVTWAFVPGATNDTFTVTVNGAPYVARTWISTSAEPTTLEAANVRQGSASNAANLQFDDYVVTEVIPEPTSLAAIGLGALGLLRRRRGC